MTPGKRPDAPVIENVDPLTKAMRRAQCNAAFFFTVPGPKMIWQFGELGYDISIEQGGRTGRKPLHWEYYDDEDRRALYDTYAGLIRFRRENPRFFDADAAFSWTPATSAWPLRTVSCEAAGKHFFVVGNFGSGAETFTVEAPADAVWTDWFEPSVTFDGQAFNLTLKEGEFRLFVD